MPLRPKLRHWNIHLVRSFCFQHLYMLRDSTRTRYNSWRWNKWPRLLKTIKVQNQGLVSQSDRTLEQVLFERILTETNYKLTHCTVLYSSHVCYYYLVPHHTIAVTERTGRIALPNYYCNNNQLLFHQHFQTYNSCFLSLERGQQKLSSQTKQGLFYVTVQ